jgi:hypothetical protein
VAANATTRPTEDAERASQAAIASSFEEVVTDRIAIATADREERCRNTGWSVDPTRYEEQSRLLDRNASAW